MAATLWYGGCRGPWPLIWWFWVEPFSSSVVLFALWRCLDRLFGLWTAFLSDPVQLIGVEPRGRADGPSSATLCDGSPGLLHGARTIVLQDSEGQILEAECLAAGLDYPGVGPKHAELQETGRATYVSVNDDEALDAFEALSELEGIVPAFESSHAIAYLKKSATAGHLKNIKSVIVCLSGSGRKDLDTYFALNRENNS